MILILLSFFFVSCSMSCHRVSIRNFKRRQDKGFFSIRKRKQMRYHAISKKKKCNFAWREIYASTHFFAIHIILADQKFDPHICLLLLISFQKTLVITGNVIVFRLSLHIKNNLFELGNSYSIPDVISLNLYLGVGCML